MDRGTESALIGLLLLGGISFLGLIVLSGLKNTGAHNSQQAPPYAWQLVRADDGYLVAIVPHPLLSAHQQDAPMMPRLALPAPTYRYG